MKLTYTCSLVSRGFKLVDQAVGYDMQDAARLFLMDDMGALAAQRFNIRIVDDLQSVPEAHTTDAFILSGGVGTQQPWTLTVAQLWQPDAQGSFLPLYEGAGGGCCVHRSDASAHGLFAL